MNLPFPLSSLCPTVCELAVTTSLLSSVTIMPLAQITPSPEKFGSNNINGDTADSSPDTDASNDNQPPSEKSDEIAEELTDSTDSNGANSGQTTTPHEDQTTATEEQSSDPTSQLVEVIKNKVNKVLSASGIINP